MIRITKHRRLAVLAASVALSAVALAGCSSTNGGGGETGGNNLEGDIAAGSVGTVDQFADIADICVGDAEAYIGSALAETGSEAFGSETEKGFALCSLQRGFARSKSAR